mmetsp:Transcript_36724/g.79264  ORF Transcript_36724/g.79264 Transcript_36724/m.79264 type:complete len:403 (-) Transcript_36724:67-1275(-)
MSSDDIDIPANKLRPVMPRRSAAAPVGSLRVMLESLSFDTMSSVRGVRGYDDIDGNDDSITYSDTTQSYSGSSSASSVHSDESWEAAGYDNEDDYLFDQYGGIGGTDEERVELAEALAHTLDVGPIGDDLFYEEVAMCFLRCRERHRIRTRREEVMRDWRRKKNDQRKGHEKLGKDPQPEGSGHDEGEAPIREHVTKMDAPGKRSRRSHSFRVTTTTASEKSEYKIYGDEDEDEEKSINLSDIFDDRYNIHEDKDNEDDDSIDNLSCIFEDMHNVYEGLRRYHGDEEVRDDGENKNVDPPPHADDISALSESSMCHTNNDDGDSLVDNKEYSDSFGSNAADIGTAIAVGDTARARLLILARNDKQRVPSSGDLFAHLYSDYTVFELASAVELVKKRYRKVKQ